jgi:hypothetical protein
MTIPGTPMAFTIRMQMAVRQHGMLGRAAEVREPCIRHARHRLFSSLMTTTLERTSRLTSRRSKLKPSDARLTTISALAKTERLLYTRFDLSDH